MPKFITYDIFFLCWTLFLCSLFRPLGLHFFDQPWLSSARPWGRLCRPLPHLPIPLHLVPPLLQAAVSPTRVSVRDIVTAEASNHGGSTQRQNKETQISCRQLAIRKNDVTAKPH